MSRKGKKKGKKIERPILEPHQVFKALLDESDRGCILVAHAYLDEKIGEFLKILFVHIGGHEADIANFLKQWQFNPFTFKVAMVKACGKIKDNNIIKILDAFNELRNDFAHISHANKLVEDDVKALCKQIDQLNPEQKSELKRWEDIARLSSKNWNYTRSRVRVKFMGLAVYLWASVEKLISANK
jgi:hypothetical protein